MANGTPGPDPAVRKRRLRNELRQAREKSAMTQGAVAAAMDWSPSKLIRIETGAVNVSTNDLRALLNLYNVPADRVRTLVELARAAREVPRWNIYRDVASPAYIAFLGYEWSASIVRNFEPQLVPELLQTEEYARAVIAVVESDRPHHIDALVDLRTERQEVLTKQPPTEFHFILDEAVIRRTVGGAGVMKRQLLHLLEVEQYPNVAMRVVPFNAGLYPRLRTPYVLFEFPDDEDEDVAYLEDSMGQYLIRENSPGERNTTNPGHYLEVFWELEQLASRHDFARSARDALADLERASQDDSQIKPVRSPERSG